MDSGNHPVAATTAEHSERALGVLTLAFSSDPPSRWLFPESHQFIRHFPVFARALGGAAFEEGTAFVTAAFTGVALWLGPGVGPDEEALDSLIGGNVAPDRQKDMAGIVEQMVRYHPSEPHWYLPFIGVEPIFQNAGIGASLLHTQLARCDTERLPAYLESTNPRNRPLYRRFGFEPVAEIKVGDCPPIVPMLRRPRAA